MDKNKPLTQTSADAVTPVKFWGTIALAGILLLLSIYFLAALFRQPGIPVIYIAIAVFLFVIAVSVITFVLVLRQRQELGLKLSFYALFMIGFAAALLFQGRAILASLVILAMAAITIRWLLPRQAWRWYVGFTAAVTILIWIIEWLNPPWRISPAVARVGPAAVVVFGLILAFIVLRQTWGRSMRNKLLVALLGVTLVAVGALAVSTYTTTSNILQQSLERELTQHVEGVSNRIGDLLVEQVTTLTALSLDEVLQQTVDEINQTYAGNASAIQATLDARDVQWRAADAADNNSDPLVQKYLSNQAALDLKEFQKTFPNHVEVFITDKYGGQAGTTNRTSDYLQSDEGWWQAAYNNGQGAVYISEPEFDESAGALSVLMAMPIRNRETGEIIGILRTTYLVSALNPIFGELVGQTGRTDLFVPGEVVSRFRGGQYTPVEPEVYADLQAVAGQGMVQMDYEGKSSVVLQAPVKTSRGNPAVDSLGWVVVFHQNQEEAFAPLNAQTRGVLVVVAIIVILALAAAIGLSVVLVRPITRLTQTAEEVAAGNLNSRAEVTSTDEIGTLASTFNSMTSQLQETLGSLEQRVAARTRDLAIVAEVGTTTATILEADKLLQAVVDLTKERFGLYHSHIYLLDEKGENLVLAAGAGEPGRIMAAEKRSIPLSREQSLVARAARERKGVIVNDVTLTPDFLPNPLLPNTCSELAVPLLVGDTLIGVFDIQSDVVGRFTESDVNIQTTLAAQLAASVQNARSYERSKQQADLETLVNAIGQKIQRATTVEGTLQTAIRELGTALGAARVKAKIGRSNGDN